MVIFNNKQAKFNSHDIYKDIFKENQFSNHQLQQLEDGIFPIASCSATKNVITYINNNDKLNTDLYRHMNLNDLAYIFQHFYNVPCRYDNNGNIHIDMSLKEIQMIIEYSEFLFKKYCYGVSREEREEIAEFDTQQRSTLYEIY
ncbi:hypothetical protein [Sutcliffiella cohnii]|uniref:hypothetical protein n=1 Tax=Sutcliffiella cohnii TaxID=33932 RepID=UPI002E25087C|nr:hypothetical protein [Sutcliffiella cohnii]